MLLQCTDLFWWQLCASKCCTCFNELSLFIRHIPSKFFSWNSKQMLYVSCMYVVYIPILVCMFESCMYVLVFQRKPCLCLMNRLNSMKHVQHFDAHNCHQKKKKKKENKKEKYIQLTTFKKNMQYCKIFWASTRNVYRCRILLSLKFFLGVFCHDFNQ